MGVDCLLNHAGDSCSMLLACIAVCMSNTSFSLHGFSVHVPCQTLSFSQPSSILFPSFSLSPQKLPFKVLNSPSVPYFSPSLLLFSAFLFFITLHTLAKRPPPPPLPPLPPCILCTKFLNDASFTLYLSLEGLEV